MGSIISVTTSRGGAGKTSLCRLLACNLLTIGHTVAVLDTDPNETFSRWARDVFRQPDITVQAVTDHESVVATSHELSRSHTVVLVDTAGFGNQAAAMAIGAADLVLIPVMADRDSVHEVNRTLKTVRSLSTMARRAIPARVVKSRWHPNKLAERAAIEDLRAYGIETLDQHVSDLSEFAKMSFSGLVPTTGRIGQEASRLIAEIVALGAIPNLPERIAA